MGEADAAGVGGVLPARLIGVEEGAFDLGGETLGLRADRRRADDAGAGAPAGQQALQIVARHQHVRIGDDDPGVSRSFPAFDDVVELGIGRRTFVAEEDSRWPLGVALGRPPGQRRGGVVRVRQAEDQLVLRIVERERGFERRLEEGLDAAQGLDEAHRRRVSRRSEQPARAAALGSRKRHAQCVQGDGDETVGEGELSER